MVTPLISVNTLYSVGARCAIGEAEPVAKHLRLSPRQHDLWVLAHVADRDDDERGERTDDGLRSADEQYRPDGGEGVALTVCTISRAVGVMKLVAMV